MPTWEVYTEWVVCPKCFRIFDNTYIDEKDKTVLPYSYICECGQGITIIRSDKES